MKPDKPTYNQSPGYPEVKPEHTPAAEEKPAPLAPEAPQPRPETPVFQPEKDAPQPERRTQPGSPPSSDDQAHDDQQPTLPPVQPSAPPAPDDNTHQTDDNTPLIADDVDVIEKTWVDKARQIVEETKDDPHRQEQEVEKLQQSYLKKRYGKVVKPSES